MLVIAWEAQEHGRSASNSYLMLNTTDVFRKVIGDALNSSLKWFGDIGLGLVKYLNSDTFGKGADQIV
jgi:hypothetical protein